MAGATVITGGTYLLELSSGYDSSAFYLDDSTLDGTAVLDGDGADFNDITNVAQLITISRGRHKPLDVFGPGTMSVSISVPNIPYLAEGGIVTGPTLAMIGESGPEAVIPLTAKTVAWAVA